MNIAYAIAKLKIELEINVQNHSIPPHRRIRVSSGQTLQNGNESYVNHTTDRLQTMQSQVSI